MGWNWFNQKTELLIILAVKQNKLALVLYSWRKWICYRVWTM